MLRKYLVMSMLTALLAGCSSDESDDSNKSPVLDYPVLENDSSATIDTSRGDYVCYQITTSLGDIKIALDKKYAPNTTQNFENYAMLGFYDGLIFHRVIKDFMIQGGGFDANYERRETGDPIALESRNGLKNYRGRIAMARTSAPDSATSQFFINTVDNGFLNQNEAQDGYGYTVFGGVISGMDVVDQIEAVPTGSVAGMSNVPVEPVTIGAVTSTNCN